MARALTWGAPVTLATDPPQEAVSALVVVGSAATRVVVTAYEGDPKVASQLVRHRAGREQPGRHPLITRHGPGNLHGNRTVGTSKAMGSDPEKPRAQIQYDPPTPTPHGLTIYQSACQSIVVERKRTLQTQKHEARAPETHPTMSGDVTNMAATGVWCRNTKGGAAGRFWVFALCLLLSFAGARCQAELDDVILLEDQIVGHGLPWQPVRDHHSPVQHARQEKERQKIVSSARCRVRCLGNRKREDGIPIDAPYQTASLDKCLRDPACTACLKPCTQPFVNLAFCRHICEGDPSATCDQSCDFLHEIHSQRTGQCPTLEALTGFGALCVEACLVDSDCPQRQHKCCYNGCGHVCIAPSSDPVGLPEVTDKPAIAERRTEGAIELSWNSVATNVSGSILYIVYSRFNVGKHASDVHMTEWQQIAQGTETSTVIKNLSPGHWYQFQVSGVNVNGTKAPSPPTDPFILSREPASPGPPANLTEGDTVIQGDKVAVTIRWKPPVQSDLPVTRYKIFWSKRLKRVMPDYVDLKEHRHVITGDNEHFSIPDLDPDTTYFVEVQAICQYGDIRLKSEKVGVYINTYPLTHAEQRVVTSTQVVDLHAAQTPPPLTAIRVGHPFFQNGLLRANVTWSVIQDGSGIGVKKVLIHWSPEACIAVEIMDNGLPKLMAATTHELHFVIYELRFDCRYKVRVQPVSEEGGVGVESHTSFATPSCGQVDIVGVIEPDCPPSVARAPEAPANLHYSFMISSGNISAHLTWEPPLSDAPVTGYRVTWGEVSTSTVWNRNTILTKVLPEEARSFQLQDLCEAVQYLVRIQALSRIGTGKVGAVQFMAPSLTPVSTTKTPESSSHMTKYEILNPGEERDSNYINKRPSPPPKTSHQGGNMPFTPSAASAVPRGSHVILLICIFMTLLAQCHVQSATTRFAKVIVYGVGQSGVTTLVSGGNAATGVRDLR